MSSSSFLFLSFSSFYFSHRLVQHVVGKAEWRPMDKKKKEDKKGEKKEEIKQEKRKFREEMKGMRSQMEEIGGKNRAWREKRGRFNDY